MAPRQGSGIGSQWGLGQEPTYVQCGPICLSALESKLTSPQRCIFVSKEICYTGRGLWRGSDFCSPPCGAALSQEAHCP